MVDNGLTCKEKQNPLVRIKINVRFVKKVIYTVLFVSHLSVIFDVFFSFFFCIKDITLQKTRIGRIKGGTYQIWLLI